MKVMFPSCFLTSKNNFNNAPKWYLFKQALDPIGVILPRAMKQCLYGNQWSIFVQDGEQGIYCLDFVIYLRLWKFYLVQPVENIGQANI